MAEAEDYGMLVDQGDNPIGYIQVLGPGDALNPQNQHDADHEAMLEDIDEVEELMDARGEENETSEESDAGAEMSEIATVRIGWFDKVPRSLQVMALSTMYNRGFLLKSEFRCLINAYSACHNGEPVPENGPHDVLVDLDIILDSDQPQYRAPVASSSPDTSVTSTSSFAVADSDTSNDTQILMSNDTDYSFSSESSEVPDFPDAKQILVPAYVQPTPEEEAVTEKRRGRKRKAED